MKPLNQSSNAETHLRRALAARLGADRFELWFDRFQSPRVEDDAWVILAPSRFLAEQLRRRFHADLEAVQQEFGKELKLVYRVETSLADAGNDSNGLDPLTETSPSEEPSIPAVASKRRSVPQSESKEPVEKTHDGPLGSLVFGNHNRIAMAAARHVTEHPGAVTPLFIHGPTGTGKTRLLQAIHEQVLRGRRYRSLSVSAEQFMTSFLEALHGRGMPSFRAKHRDLDLLIVDDLHFLCGKRTTLIEFQNRLDQLLLAGRQVIVSANRPPAELPELGPELVGRLASGLVCGLEQPTGEAKRALIRDMAREKGIEISDEVASLIETEVSGDARHLAGALNRLVGLRLAGLEVGQAEIVHRHLADLFQPVHTTFGIQQIENAVCETFGIDRLALRSASKSRQCSQPRMLAMWLARRHTRAALSEIGDHFGGRRHSTVATAQRTVETWLEGDRPVGSVHRTYKISDAIRRIERRLASG